MKVLLVKYHGPTNTRGSRISVKAEDNKTRFFAYNYAQNDGGASIAARAYADALGWTGRLIEGGLPNGDRCFVFDYSV